MADITSQKKCSNKRCAIRKSESGNVLFLILIAVALFAALSYAVTSSTRSGGGDAASETNLVNSSAITQYPASVRTAIIRMIVSNGISDIDLWFDRPPYTNITAGEEFQVVFHPSGGGATYAEAPPDVMDPAGTNPDGEWFFNMDFEVENIATSENNTAGNEIIAFLPDIRRAICERINSELGITGIPDITPTLALNVNKNDGEPISTVNPAANMIGSSNMGAGAAELDGQAFGCFENGNGEYVYYHVLVER